MVSSCAEYCAGPDSAFYNCQLSCLIDDGFDDVCLESCNNIYGSCLDSCDSNSLNNGGGYFHGNIIQSANGAKLVFSESALADGIGTPLFTRGANLINLMIKFFPILLLIAFFGICLSALHNVGRIKKEKKDKDLSNK